MSITSHLKKREDGGLMLSADAGHLRKQYTLAVVTLAGLGGTLAFLDGQWEMPRFYHPWWGEYRCSFSATRWGNYLISPDPPPNYYVSLDLLWSAEGYEFQIASSQGYWIKRWRNPSPCDPTLGAFADFPAGTCRETALGIQLVAAGTCAASAGATIVVDSVS